MNWRNLELELELDSEIFNRKIDLEIERAKVKKKKVTLMCMVCGTQRERFINIGGTILPV